MRIALFLAGCVTLAIPPLCVGQKSAAPGLPGGDPWPRTIPAVGATILVYQPQLHDWTGTNLDAYAAVSIKAATSESVNYGVIWFTARTEVDKVNRVVTLDNFKLTKQSFPTLLNNGAAYTKAFSGDSTWRESMPLDELESSLAITQVESKQKKYELQNKPPRIIFSTRPAVLALIDGPPVLRPAGEKLQKVLNTRSLILFDPDKYMYYLALMDGWMEAGDINGAWAPASHDPKKDLDKVKTQLLEAGQNQVLGNPSQSLKQAVKDHEVPAVYVSTGPADLVMTQGPIQFTPILGTNLFYVPNTGCDIFLESTNRTYYILLAGRWFASPSLEQGNWAYVPGTSLPADFSKIPETSPKADVLVSVPGTPQAKEALIANQIPQTATISRSAAKLTVNYEGSPNFQPVPDTPLQYAVNTPTAVIYDPGKSYYAVNDAVWFTAPAPTGPWTVASSVPPVIYTIPPSSPIHYVTYVQVFGYTPNVVYVGYTPGYYGTVVSADGVVVYGTGWMYSPYIGTTMWIPAPYTYGVGAGFAWSTTAGWALGFGVGMAIGAECGPWWGPVGGWGWGYAAPAWGWGGYGGAAAANVYGHWGNTAYAGTRAAWANPYTGNIGRAGGGTYYNPVTGASGGVEHAANYNAYTGNYARGTAGAGYNAQTGIVHGGVAGTAGNAYTGQSVSGARGFAYNTNTGNGVAHAGNSVYADHDGNVYGFNQAAGWQQHNGNGWQSMGAGSEAQRSNLSNWQSARSSSSQRWGGFHSGGWGGGWGGGGFADRGGGWGGGGGFRGGGFRR
jgi:hypothetical protein